MVHPIVQMHAATRLRVMMSSPQKRKGDGPKDRRPLEERCRGRSSAYFRCLLTSFVIANMLTDALPPKTA